MEISFIPYFYKIKNMRNQLQPVPQKKIIERTHKIQASVGKHHISRNSSANRGSVSGGPASKSAHSPPQVQKQHLYDLVTNLYQSLFPSDDPETAFECDPAASPEKYGQIEGELLEEIDRLQRKQEELDVILRIGESKGARMTSEDKWKMVVVSYRDKVDKLEAKLRQERRSRQVLQQTARLQEQAKEELSHLNNIKFNKIKALLTQKEEAEVQIGELNDTIHDLTQNMSQLNQTNSLLQCQLLEQSRQAEQLEVELYTVREKKGEKEEREVVKNEVKILGEEEENVNKEITDIKVKYQGQIEKLEEKIKTMEKREQEYIILIEELESKEGNCMTGSKDSRTVDSQTQTQTLITTKACYFNSLADQLDENSEEEYGEEEDDSFQDAISLGRGKEEMMSEGEEEPDLFQIPIGGMSASNHLVYTDRPPKMKNNDARSQKEIPLRKSHLSFDQNQECHSIVSNSQSRHMETMGELTASLAQAYHKINELTEKVGELEDENARYQKKLKEREREGKKDEKEEAGGQGKNYFSSFFRK